MALHAVAGAANAASALHKSKSSSKSAHEESEGLIRKEVQRLVNDFGITVTSKIIGKGSYSRVYVGKFRDGTKCALKCAYDLYSADAHHEEAELHDIAFRVNGALPVLAFVNKAGAAKIFVLPYVETSNIKYDVKICDIDQIRTLMAGVLMSTAAMHRANIVHRDVKPKNSLPDGWSVLQTDFGLSQSELYLQSKALEHSYASIHKAAGQYQHVALKAGPQDVAEAASRQAGPLYFHSAPASSSLLPLAGIDSAVARAGSPLRPVKEAGVGRGDKANPGSASTQRFVGGSSRAGQMLKAATAAAAAAATAVQASRQGSGLVQRGVSAHLRSAVAQREAVVAAATSAAKAKKRDFSTTEQQGVPDDSRGRSMSEAQQHMDGATSTRSSSAAGSAGKRRRIEYTMQVTALAQEAAREREERFRTYSTMAEAEGSGPVGGGPLHLPVHLQQAMKQVDSVRSLSSQRYAPLAQAYRWHQNNETSRKSISETGAVSSSSSAETVTPHSSASTPVQQGHTSSSAQRDLVDLDEGSEIPTNVHPSSTSRTEAGAGAEYGQPPSAAACQGPYSCATPAASTLGHPTASTPAPVGSDNTLAALDAICGNTPVPRGQSYMLARAGQLYPSSSGSAMQSFVESVRSKLKSARSDHAGTSGFKSPEQLVGYTWTSKASDLWACGMIMLSLLTIRYPFMPGPARNKQNKADQHNKHNRQNNLEDTDLEHVGILWTIFRDGFLLRLADGLGKVLTTATGPDPDPKEAKACVLEALLSIIPMGPRRDQPGFALALDACLHLLNPDPTLRTPAEVLLAVHPFFNAGVSPAVARVVRVPLQEADRLLEADARALASATHFESARPAYGYLKGGHVSDCKDRQAAQLIQELRAALQAGKLPQQAEVPPPADEVVRLCQLTPEQLSACELLVTRQKRIEQGWVIGPDGVLLRPKRTGVQGKDLSDRSSEAITAADMHLSHTVYWQHAMTRVAHPVMEAQEAALVLMQQRLASASRAKQEGAAAATAQNAASSMPSSAGDPGILDGETGEEDARHAGAPVQNAGSVEAARARSDEAAAADHEDQSDSLGEEEMKAGEVEENSSSSDADVSHSGREMEEEDTEDLREDE